MIWETLGGLLLVSLPLIAAAGLVWFMASGKGKPAPTQDEIENAKKKKVQKG